MGNLWNKMTPKRFIWVLLCTLGLGFALVSYNAYVASNNDSTKGVLPMATAVARDLPLIDQAVVEQSEFALFALG